MMDEIGDLIAEVSAEVQKPRRIWERPYNSERAFRTGMTSLVVRWAKKRYITWDEASDIMDCVENSNIDFEGNEQG